MKIRALTACLGLALLLPACRKPAEVTVDQQRPPTMRDENLKVGASGSERFAPPSAKPPTPAPAASPFLAAFTPAGWQALPPTEFRLLNYRFGTSGEVSVGLSQGDIPANVNRWLGQFGSASLDPAAVAALEKVPLLGGDGVWVEAKGNYLPGMGQPPRPDQALAGVIARRDNQIVTVKMVGPAAEVEAQKSALRQFVAGLTPRAE